MLHADDVVAGIDVQNLPGYAAGHRREQIDRALPDFVDRDGAPQWRVVLVPFQDVTEIADA